MTRKQPERDKNMTTLDQFIKNLQKLQAEGHGHRPVYARHGASGETNEVGSARVTDHVGDCGPFDLEDPLYISIYIGN